MSAFEHLLKPTKSSPPCGDDLMSDGSLMLLQESIKSDPYASPRQEPKWDKVLQDAEKALEAGKDIRAAVILSLAALHKDGVAGFRDGLLLIHGLLHAFPDAVHPVPEQPDDQVRGYALSNLAAPLGSDSPYQFVAVLRNKPLVVSPAGKEFTLADLKRADRNQPVEGAESVPTRELIEASFRSAGSGQIQKAWQLFEEVRLAVDSIESVASVHAGTAAGMDLKALKEVLGEILAELKPWTGQADLATPSVPAGQAGNPATPGGPSLAEPVVVGGIRSREDARKTMRAVAEYFRQNEPSSPIPFFLARVERLIGRDFIECVRDLSSDSLNKFYPLFGINPSADADEKEN